VRTLYLQADVGQIVKLYRLTLDQPARNTQPRYNICPTTTIDTFVSLEGKRSLVPMRCGLIPYWWNKPLKEMRLATFDARAETVATKPMFRRIPTILHDGPEGKIVYARLWANDDTDTADKLVDAKPLTQNERNALVTLHRAILRCREIVIEHDNRYAAWETPYWQELFERSDAIFYKLASGEITVGLANKLTIDSAGRFQTDVSKGHADAVREDDARRQAAAQTMLQASAQILASQPRTQLTTTNCSWVGNNLNCSSIR
jgi:hypothetical protein